MVAQDAPYVAEVIDLNGRAMIRVKHGAYLVGYFYTVREVEERLKREGIPMSDLTVKE